MISALKIPDKYCGHETISLKFINFFFNRVLFRGVKLYLYSKFQLIGNYISEVRFHAGFPKHVSYSRMTVNYTILICYSIPAQLLNKCLFVANSAI